MAKMRITSAALLAFSAATSTAAVGAFLFPAAPNAPGAGRRAISFTGFKPLRATTLPQQDTRTEVLRRPKEAPRESNVDIGIVSAEDDDCTQSRLRRLAYYFLQVPMYGVKFPFAIALGLWGARFWRVPNEADVVKFVEETGIILVLHRGVPPGTAPPSTKSSADTDERHYYVDVKKCLLDHVTREHGKEDVTTTINSWSMTYTKTRHIGDGAGWGAWTTKINSFVVNGKPVTDPANQMSFLHVYATMGAHTKCHVYGNTLVQRIYKSKHLRKKLMKSTWNTIWLHRGLLHGGLGPLTTVRTEENKWAGLASPCRSEALVAESSESSDMSSLGGCQHGLAQRWIDLDLPLSTFMMNARMSVRRVMIDHDIPMDLLEAVFLSVVMHAIDHVQGSRCMWGLRFELDLWDQPARRPFICESAVWNFMWATPTINPFYDNKIRRISKPFYRQLYREMKKIDTLNVADEITASIMY